MDFDEEMDLDVEDRNDDSSNESSGEFAMVEEPNDQIEGQEEDYPFEVMTTEQILQHMNDCIKEVNVVVEVRPNFPFFFCRILISMGLFVLNFQMPPTVIRMLLNHFHWDKDNFMDSYYDGDKEKLFTEAHVVNPFAKAAVPAKVAKREHRRTVPNVEECEVSFSL